MKKVKIKKEAGFNVIYLEILKNTGIEIQAWLAELYSDILKTSKIPDILKRSKIIILLKPDKAGTEAANHHSVTLLSVIYKLLEILISSRTQPTLDKYIPIKQAGFRNNHTYGNSS